MNRARPAPSLSDDIAGEAIDYRDKKALPPLTPCRMVFTIRHEFGNNSIST